MTKPPPGHGQAISHGQVMANPWSGHGQAMALKNCPDVLLLVVLHKEKRCRAYVRSFLLAKLLRDLRSLLYMCRKAKDSSSQTDTFGGGLGDSKSAFHEINLDNYAQKVDHILNKPLLNFELTGHNCCLKRLVGSSSCCSFLQRSFGSCWSPIVSPGRTLASIWAPCREM